MRLIAFGDDQNSTKLLILMKPSSDLWESFSIKFLTDFGRNAQCYSSIEVVNEIRIHQKK